MLKKILNIIKSIFAMLKICKRKDNNESTELTLVPAVKQESPCKIVKFVGEYIDEEINWQDGDYWITNVGGDQIKLWRYYSSLRSFLEESPKHGFLYYYKNEKELYVWDEESKEFILLCSEDMGVDERINTALGEMLDSYRIALPISEVVTGEDIDRTERRASGTTVGEVVFSQQHNAFLLNIDGTYYETWDPAQGVYSSSAYGDAQFVYTAEKAYLVTPNGLIE